GTNLGAAILIVLALILITGKSFGAILSSFTHGITSFFKNQKDQIKQELTDWRNDIRTKREQRRKQKENKRKAAPLIRPKPAPSPPPRNQAMDTEEPIIHDFSEREPEEQPKPPMAQPSAPVDPEADSPTFSASEVENKDYQLPSLDILLLPQKNNQNKQKQY